MPSARLLAPPCASELAYLANANSELAEVFYEKVSAALHVAQMAALAER
jgi:hypothetical protein